MRRRVVVTGMGMVTPVGNDLPSSWDAMLAGRSGIARITTFDPAGYRGQIAGEVKDFDPLLYMDAKDARHTDRAVQFAVASTREAVRDARLDMSEEEAVRVGVIFGTAVGGVGMWLAQSKVLEERGPSRVSPFILGALPDAASVQIAIMLGARGPNMTITSACASGGHAIGEATETIRRGSADVMLAGGSDALILPVMLAGFGSMRALATDNDHPGEACKPFDLHRDGFVVSEGAGTLVLEEAEHAAARGAHVYAEVAGYGTGNDAFHVSIPAEDGAGTACVMQMALCDAGMQPEAIGYINAHGTGTVLNDKYETIAIKRVFGEHAHHVPISSVKSMIGHLMGAAGAVEAIISILAITQSIVPPTTNLRTPDPECDLDYVPNAARHVEVSAALSNSIGLGGHNSAVIFKKAK